MPSNKLRLGWMLELIPREPPPAMEGLTLVGHVVLIDAPRFGLDVGGGVGQLFRLDELGELCVREVDRHLFELGRTFPPLSWSEPTPESALDPDALPYPVD
jgi:hypothetical protein